MGRSGGRLFVLRELWDRYVAVVCTTGAGAAVALRPAPSIDRLVGGYPATWLLGMTLALGAFLNLVGLIRGSYTLQRFGLVVQIWVLLLLVLALFAVAAAAGLAVGLLLVALVARLHQQYRILAAARALALAALPARLDDDS